MRNVRIGCAIVIGAVGLLAVVGLETRAYAAPLDGGLGEKGSDVITVFDPFTLTRIAVEPSRSANQPVLLGNRGANDGDGNGNGQGNGNRHRPPVVVPNRPVVRSPWAPPFGVGR
jgi:hypothetical protein